MVGWDSNAHAHSAGGSYTGAGSIDSHSVTAAAALTLVPMALPLCPLPASTPRAPPAQTPTQERGSLAAAPEAAAEGAVPAGVGGWPAGQPGQQEGGDLRVQELLRHEGHLEPLALEAGKVIHCRRMPGGGLLHSHCGGRWGGASAWVVVFSPIHA